MTEKILQNVAFTNCDPQIKYPYFTQGQKLFSSNIIYGFIPSRRSQWEDEVNSYIKGINAGEVYAQKDVIRTQKIFVSKKKTL